MARSKVDDWLTDDSLQTLKEWARAGYTDKEIYQAIHISKATFYNWLRDNPVLKEAIDAGRAPVILEVENAFIASLKDRWINETSVTEYDDGRIVKTAHRRFVPGKTGAQIFYLKTHKHDEYGEHQDFYEKKRLEIELEKAKKDLEIKDLQIKKLTQELEEISPEIPKVDQILEALDREAFKETE